MIFVYCNDNPFNFNNFLISIKNHEVVEEFTFLIASLTEESKRAFEIVIKHYRTYGIIDDNNIRAHFLSNPINPKEEIVELLKDCEREVIGFMTSEDIFYSWDKNNSIKSIANLFTSDSQLFSFSLRLGKNITFNSLFKAECILIPLEETEDVVIWDWDKHYLDFSAPLSMHGNFFRRKEILKMIKASSFHDFDSLEDALQIYNNFPKKKMGSFVGSKIVSLFPEVDPRKSEAIKKSETKLILSRDLSKTIKLPEEVNEQFIKLAINGLEKQ